MADAQRRQGKHHHHRRFHHQEDVHRLGVIPVMVLKRVQQNGAKNGRAKAQRGLLCRAEDARAFLPGLEACRIVERSEGAAVQVR